MHNDYLVLARKYRPKRLSDLLGQELMVTILKNAFLNNRMGQAFLLTGIRGVGKTTTARIIAACFNCQNLTDMEPCWECENCSLISKQEHPDIIEIDAASRSKVEDIRELISSLVYDPICGKFKVLIIDEVHMLSKSAFNAMLKTLEEPPEKVRFILATTELNKIPDTIVSRCQSFYLKRLSSDDIANGIKDVLHNEGLELDKDSIELISHSSYGSMRDALSILEQVLCLENPTPAQVRNLLGLADEKQLYKLLELCMSSKLEDALALAQDIYNDGCEVKVIMGQMLKLSQKLSMSKDQTKNTGFFVQTWKMLINALEELTIFEDPLTNLNMTILKICYGAKIHPISDLLNNNAHNDKSIIDHLEKIASQGGKINLKNID